MVVFKISELEKNNKLAYFLLAPFIIYLYFLKWKLTSIHDDDLYIYRAYADADSFFHKANVSYAFGQYRPVRDIFLHTIIKIFGKDLDGYYFFNVLIQSVNTIIFALLLNRFLSSVIMSVFLSLIFGLSRFCFYTITQLFNGGLLEGLAMTFFLLFLFCLVKMILMSAANEKKQMKGLLWSILFVNLSMYTHERYISIFPFFLLLIWFLPQFRRILIRNKIIISFLSIGSVLLNFFIKTSILSMPFFTGSGNIPIEFSVSSVSKFLWLAIASVFQYSIGPEYVSGLQFESLPAFYKALVGLIIIITLIIIGLFIWRIAQAFLKREKQYPFNTALFILLPALWLLCLVPVVLQVRIELRWLQAPLVVMILMFVIALTSMVGSNNNRKYIICFLFGIAFLLTNYYYVSRGSKNLYYTTSATIANAFDKAVRDSIIPLKSDKLYIWEKQRNQQREGEINWSLVNGYFFSQYNGVAKNVIFADSLPSLNSFNNGNDEILYLDIQNDGQSFRYFIDNITDEFLADSLRKFNRKKFGKTDPAEKINYPQGTLIIKSNAFDDFITSGFYDYENGIRWTTGNSTVELRGDYMANDSVRITLSTYMPPICKDVKPAISIVDRGGKVYTPVSQKRDADDFIFTFIFKQAASIHKINIASNKINAVSDQRILSFPFISMKIEKD